MFSVRLIERLRAARAVVVFTGAGVSAESGVPTFRGSDGLWTKFKPEELASFDAFQRNPDLVWEWYRHRKQIIAAIQPNAGHYAIAELERRVERCAVITQNIDNLHRRAGTRTVFELHGNIERNSCIACGAAITNEFVLAHDHAPRCPDCGGAVRPDVVWFGEMLPEDEWNSSVVAAESADVMVAVGTSGVVYPAASNPQIAKRAGAFLVEVNLERTELSRFADEILIGRSGEILPRLIGLFSSSETIHRTIEPRAQNQQ